MLRLALVYFPRKPDDDTDVYRELGYNLLHHGTYGLMEDGDLSPSLFRLPGYPLFLNFLGGNLLVVQLAQIALDLLGCVLLALLVRRCCGDRAGLWTLGLGATCVFTAIYAAAGMTECLTVFSIALAMWGLGRLLEHEAPFAGRGLVGRLLPIAAASGLAMLLRPDGALLTISAALALVWYGMRRAGWRKAIPAALLFCCLAAVPLVPWTIRNAVTFHVFQPLAPRHVNDPGERVNTGFYDWMRTWTFEFESTGAVFWRAGSEQIHMEDIPDLAFDSPGERAQTAALIARYNARKDIDQRLDDEFEALARQRVHANPLRYYVALPVLRVLDMTFRPRVDSTWIPADWQELVESPGLLALAVLFAVLNLFYFGAAVAGVVNRQTRQAIPLGMFMATYIVLRCVMLGSMENPEPRYTVEFFPLVLVCAGVWLGRGRDTVSEIEV